MTHKKIIWTTIILLLFIAAIVMRLHYLNSPFDFDSYDEGVYWQSLKAMANGYSLYSQIFYSQPPLFLISIYPFFILFGQTILAARLGIVLFSLIGILSVYLIGKNISGRLGALAGIVLLISSPLYLKESQTLQAEMVSLALSLLAIALAYSWFKLSNIRKNIAIIILCGLSLALSILSKLTGLTVIIPIGILVLSKLWKDKKISPAIIMILSILITSLIVLLPYTGLFDKLFQQVILFHTAAKQFFARDAVFNWQIIQSFLTGNIFLTLAAFLGIISIFIRRNWLGLPLVAWLIVSLTLLKLQVPLFYHHTVILTPILIILAIVDLDKLNLLNFLRMVLIGIVIIVNIIGINNYYQGISQKNISLENKKQIQIVSDLKQNLKPDQLIITDNQFIAGLANRNVPPNLTDTSIVRIKSDYLKTQELIKAADNPKVQAILFYSNRFQDETLVDFKPWVTENFHLFRDYGNGIELWIK